jgi:hypothetical protein
MSKCRHCSSAFEPKAWQIATRDYECDQCRRARQEAWRAKRKADGRPVVSGRMPLAYHRAYQRSYFQDEGNRERRNALMRANAKLHADHHKARRKVRHEIVMGRMQRQPCEVCGAEEVHAHHDDYSKPLDVRWLCPSHHREHHAKATGTA